MKKLISILTAMMLLFTFAAAEQADNSDKNGFNAVVDSVTVAFDANATTGYQWTAFVVGGNSVMIDEENSGYVSDANPNLLDGVGGTHYFVIKALQPGESIIRFVYSRGWEEGIADETYLLVTVGEDALIDVRDVTMDGVYGGVVVEVNEAEHSVLISTNRVGDVVVRFDENETLPAEGESILVYTNGTMTMSLPPIVNAIGWSTVAGDMARE